MNATKKKAYYQLIPEKVLQNLKTIDEILYSEICGYSPVYLREVISIIACHVRNHDNKNDHKNDDEDPPLNMEIMRRKVPYAERYIKGLRLLGIVKRTGFYVPNQISYRYNFTPEYQSKYIPLSLDDARMIQRITTAFDYSGKEAMKMIWGNAIQVKYLKQLTLDDGWREMIEAYRENEDQYNAMLASAMRIINKDWFYSIDPTEHRFHSNVTNMKRELRQYLRINGKPLINLDVKNSQPYISTILLTYPSKVAWFAKNPAFQMLLQSLKISLNEDVTKYISLVASGRFYEYLMQEFALEGLDLTRDETKEQVLRILFACNRMPRNEIKRKCRLIFKDRFPTVHKIFSKVRGREQGTKFENSNRFAILLATIESHLILNVIVKRINKELPGVIVITIHDSIMTGILTDEVEAVRKIMTEVLKEFVGFEPRIEIEGNKERKKEENNREKMLIQYDVKIPVSSN